MRQCSVADQLRFLHHGLPESDIEKHDLGYMRTGSGWGEREVLPKGWLAAFRTGGYEGEMPLLEELDIDFRRIRTRVGRFSMYGGLVAADKLGRP